MEHLFTEEQKMLRESARTLISRVANADYVRRLDRNREYPEDLYAALVEAGFLAAPFPEEYGGMGGSIIDVAIISEEIGRVSSDFVMGYGLSMFCGLNILQNASGEFKNAWLPKLISGEVKFSIGLSEPNAGTDLGAIRTRAVRDGDDYVINGTKTWQSGAGAKDNVINLYLRTGDDPDHRQSLSLLLVPNDVPGVHMRKLDMLGRYCTGTYEVTFDNARVPVANLVGNEKDGWKYLLSGLNAERAVAAACDLGSASAVVDMSLEYAKERKQFGRPIGSFQALAHRLADIQCEVEAARALVWKAVWLAANNEGEETLRIVTMAKLFAAETYVKASNVAMQVFGGNGYSMEYDIQRHYRDCRISTVAAGSAEMLRNLIAGLSGLRIQ